LKQEQNIHRQEKSDDPFAVQNRGVVSVDFSLKKK
jgi:hypothetical protein